MNMNKEVNKMSKEAIIFGFAVVVVVTMFPRSPLDDTDGLEERSGLKLYIDRGTGCHYLQGGFMSNVILRLDANGKHICRVSDVRSKK